MLGGNIARCWLSLGVDELIYEPSAPRQGRGREEQTPFIPSCKKRLHQQISKTDNKMMLECEMHVF